MCAYCVRAREQQRHEVGAVCTAQPIRVSSIQQAFINLAFLTWNFFLSLRRNCAIYLLAQNIRWNEQFIRIDVATTMWCNIFATKSPAPQAIGQSWHRAESFRLRTVAEPARFFFFHWIFFFFFLLVTNFFFFCYTSLRTNPYRTIPISAAGWSGRPFFSSGNRTAKNRIFLPNGLEIRVVIFFLFV